MTEVSPSSKKVDEFLSSLSQISQERLRENQKRQRDLQRDIDDLRRSSTSSPYSPLRQLGASNTENNHGITEIKFNRSARSNFFEKWKDVAPELPKRPQDEEGPPLPSRPKPEKPQKPQKLPTLPTRPSNVIEVERIVDIARPVARVVEKPEVRKSLVQVPQYRASTSPRSSEPTRLVTFSEMESKIQSGSRVFATNSGLSDLKKPMIPNKPKDLKKESTEETGKTVATKFEGFGLAKPLKPVKPPTSSFKPSTLAPEKKEPPTKPAKPEKPAKPGKPEKPSFKSFQAQDSQELQNQILRLSPTKSASRETKPAPVEEIKPFGSLKPVKPAKPTSLDVPEALNALAKLKPAKPAPIKTLEPVLRTPIKSSSVAGPKADLKASSPELSKEQPDFHAKLSNILRASTEPTLGASISEVPEPIRRTQSSTPANSTPAKLTHPNKSRAKGPKRKLPKQLNASETAKTGKFGASSDSGTSATISAPTETPTTEKPPAEILGMANSARQISVKPLKKAPPPIRGKKPNLEPRQKRIVSGELFL